MSKDAPTIIPEDARLLFDTQDGAVGTEDELKSNDASASTSYVQSDDLLEGQRKSLLHQGTTEYRDIREEALAPDDTPAVTNSPTTEAVEQTAENAFNFRSVDDFAARGDIPLGTAFATSSGPPQPSNLSNGSTQAQTVNARGVDAVQAGTGIGTSSGTSSSRSNSDIATPPVSDSTAEEPDGATAPDDTPDLVDDGADDPVDVSDPVDVEAPVVTNDPPTPTTPEIVIDNDVIVAENPSDTLDDPVVPETTGEEPDDPVMPDESDANDAPMGLTLSNTTVVENDAGAVIGTVAATDADGDVLSYGVDDARFEVVDGALQLRDGVALDHEVEPSVSVTLTATDPDGAAVSETFVLSVGDVEVPPAELTVSTGFHVEQFAVADGVLSILGVDFTQEPVGELYTPTIDFPSTPFSFVDTSSTDVFATQVTGWINVEEEGSYDFRLTTGDTAVVWIDGVSTIVSAVEGVVTLEIGSQTLGVGEHEIVIQHLDLNGDAEMTLEWMGPGDSDFSLVPASPLGTIENNDDAGFIVDIDPGTATVEGVTLTGVPDNWVISADGNAGTATDGEIDVTGWDLSQLVITPASDDLGSVTIGVETELRGPTGEVESSTSNFDVTVVPENGIVIDLDIDLGLLDVGVDDGLDAAGPDVDLDVDGGLGGDLIGSLVSSDGEGDGSVVF